MSQHILLVDDEKEFRFAAGIALRTTGYLVTMAGDGEEAFAKIVEARDRGADYDLLLLDIRMPRMSGIELIDLLSRSGIVIPTVVMTCFGDSAQVAELMSKGCSEYVEKPFRPEELVGRIAGILKTRSGDPAAPQTEEGPGP